MIARWGALPLAEWPAADRCAWDAACQPGARLRRGGRASHLKLVTRNDLARRYALFLNFVSGCGHLIGNAEAGAHVTPLIVAEFVQELRARVGSVTVARTIYKLRRTTEIIAPDKELAWLRELQLFLEDEAKPRSKLGRLVLAERLVEAGLTLMVEADAALHRTPLQRAIAYRNGLMIALLACCPIRMKNFSSLRIGSTLVQTDADWWIVLSADQTKERRADERRIPAFLKSHLERYIAVHRATLAPHEANASLWISLRGSCVSPGNIHRAITGTTTKAVGVSVNPHLFRSSAATTAAIHAGKTPHLASALLDHRKANTTAQHYNRATSLSAGATYADVIAHYKSEQ